jgi:antitoxin component of MazEF toxin-antitoxin module
MKVVKIRRVGNSNVVSLPRALEALGYGPGTEVVIDELPNGELRLMPTEMVRSRMQALAHQVNEENHEAMELLETYDRGDVPVP